MSLSSNQQTWDPFPVNPDWEAAVMSGGIMLGNGSEHKMKSIVDGTSSTVILSERCATPGDGTQIVEFIKGGVYGNGFDQKNQLPSACMAKKGSRGRYDDTGQPEPKGGSGTNFAYYTFQNGFFHTILAPNGPSCSWTNANLIGTEAAILPPTSFHVGGVNVCMADGAGRYIADNIDTGNLSARFPSNLDSEIIASPFGIWGALGSMNGREAIKLP
jgi:hypothetical protein